jgi:hypothetical protein
MTEDIRSLFITTWREIVENCLRPLTPDQVRRGLQLLDVVPLTQRTSFYHRFRSAVYEEFHQHATGRELRVNVTGTRATIQLTYTDDLNTIVRDEARENFRELFVTSLARASYVYRNSGNEELRQAAEDLVVAIENL